MNSIPLRAALAFALCFVVRDAAADLPIYDDALRNGFVDLSWPGPLPNPDMNYCADFHVYQGVCTIFYKAHDWNGLSFGRPGQPLTTAEYPQLTAWIRGDAGGERLTVHLQSGGSVVASAPLEAFVAGGTIGNGAYQAVVIPFAAPPLGYAGAFDRIDLQDASGIGGGDAQWVFIDEIRLVAAGDVIFASGFEP